MKEKLRFIGGMKLLLIAGPRIAPVMSFVVMPFPPFFNRGGRRGTQRRFVCFSPVLRVLRGSLPKVDARKVLFTRTVYGKRKQKEPRGRRGSSRVGSRTIGVA